MASDISMDTTWSGSVEGFASLGRFETKLRIDDCIFRDYIARHVYTRCVEFDPILLRVFL